MIPQRDEGAESADLDVAFLIRQLGITHEDFKFVMRDVLWIACCYNDHDFTPEDLFEAARRIRRNLMVGKPADWVAEANRVMEIICAGAPEAPSVLGSSGDSDSRQAFEAWIAAPPYERDTYRWPEVEDSASWPGHYKDIEVQLAWEAWSAARAK